MTEGKVYTLQRVEADRAVAATLSESAPAVVRVHESDNVAVATREIPAGVTLELDGVKVRAAETIPPGHKVSLGLVRRGDVVRKYGFAIGAATTDIEPGHWVHSHNLATQLRESATYTYVEHTPASAKATKGTFDGFVRANGRVGTRNEIWIINTVGCVNTAAERIARAASERFKGAVDGVFSYSHPYGCSQLGDDLANTQRILAGLMRHPNAGGVLVLGLGCENNQMDDLLATAGDVNPERLRFFNTQDVVDEVETGLDAVAELVHLAETDRRQSRPLSDLVLGHKCGGSDGFSGLSANPLLGLVADRLTAARGSVILTEVPEMFGAEHVLLGRAASKSVFDDTARMINDFKQYFVDHGQPVYENPSPGNKAGGLTTLEEKSLGAIQKGGAATVEHVLRYGELAPVGGLSLLESPGNDAVSSTALVASGATMLLFTTGRGTPLGFPVPTLKVSSNSDIARRKPHWIDFDAGRLLDGATTRAQLADELVSLIIEAASGRTLLNNEKQGYREIAIWKEGVTL